MPNNSANNKRIAKNSILLSIRMVIVLGIMLYTTRLLLEVLGVVDYGVYNVVCGFVSMFTFLTTSMSNGIQRFYNYELGRNGEKGANKVYCTSLFIQLILALVIILLTESFGLWYLYHKMVIPDGRLYAAEWIFHSSVVSFLFIIMQAPYTAAVMAHERMDFYALMSVIDAVLKLLIVLMVPHLAGDRLIVYGILFTLISLFDFCCYLGYSRRKFAEIRLQRSSIRGMFRDMLSFSGWNLFGSFSNMMREQGVNLIMNFFFGPVVNAARGVAAQINSGVNSFVSNILTPVRPQVIQAYAQGNLERSMHLTYSISKFSLCFLYMMALPICMEIDYILKIWLGDAIPEHTQSFVIIILLTSAILIPMGALATLVHASGKMRNYQVYGSIVKFLSVPVAYYLLSLGYAPEWALWMVFIFDLLGLIVGMFILKSIMPFQLTDYFRRIVLPLVPVAAIPYLAIYPIHLNMEEGFLRLAIVLVASVLTIMPFFYFIGMSASERTLVMQLTHLSDVLLSFRQMAGALYRFTVKNRRMIRKLAPYLRNGVYQSSVHGDVFYEKDAGQGSFSTFSSFNTFNRWAKPFVMYLQSHCAYRISTPLQSKLFYGSRVIISSSGTETKVFDKELGMVLTQYRDKERMLHVMANKAVCEDHFLIPRTLSIAESERSCIEQYICHNPFQLQDAIPVIVGEYLCHFIASQTHPLASDIRGDEARAAYFAEWFGDSLLLRQTIGLPRCVAHGDLWSSNIIFDGQRYFVTDFESVGERYFLYDFFYLLFSEWLLKNDDVPLTSYYHGTYDNFVQSMCKSAGILFDHRRREIYLLAFLVTITAERWRRGNVVEVKVKETLQRFVPEYFK